MTKTRKNFFPPHRKSAVLIVRSMNGDGESDLEAIAAEFDDMKTWLDIQRSIADMFQRAATACFIERNRAVTERQRRKYFHSSKILVLMI